LPPLQKLENVNCVSYDYIQSSSGEIIDFICRGFHRLSGCESIVVVFLLISSPFSVLVVPLIFSDSAF